MALVMSSTLVSKAGVKIDPRKICCIQEWLTQKYLISPPTTGDLSILRVQKASPLSQLTEKKQGGNGPVNEVRLFLN